MARRKAGKLGDGGGPGWRVHIFPPPCPTVLGKAQVLQIGKGDTGHQRVPVKSCPGAALKVAQPQFLLELLVALLAHPARLDSSRQGAG